MKKKIAVTVFLLCAVYGMSASTTNVFTAADGSFHTPANWTPQTVPDNTVDVQISNGGTARITADAQVRHFGVGVTGPGSVVQTAGNVYVSGEGGVHPSSFFLSGGNSLTESYDNLPNRTAVYHLAGGSVDVRNCFCHIGQYAGANYSSEGILKITDGTFFAYWWAAVGRFRNSHGHVLIEDNGLMNVTKNGINIGENGVGVMTVKNNGRISVNGQLTLAALTRATGRGYVRSGGRVTAAQIRGTGVAVQNGLFADGGILSPDCAVFRDNEDYRNAWITGLDAFNVGTKGVIFDTAGKSARVPQTVAVAEVPARLTTDNLVHRWCFNGDLSDAVGGQEATGVGGYWLDGAAAVLPGGAKGTGYIDLGSDILPKDGSGVTLEIWATQFSAQTYSRVFEIGERSSTHTMSMAWSTGIDTYRDRIGITYNNQTFYDVGKTGPYVDGEQYHLAWVFTPPADETGAWTITVYKHDATTGELINSYVYNPPAGWTLPAAPQNNCWLGHSLYNDADAAAAYDEVRVWKKALTEAELAASVRLGPDTAFGTSGAIVKRGFGRLEMVSVTGAREIVVEEGTLAAGTGGAVPLLHRWTFNGGDLQDKVGSRDATLVAPTDAAKTIEKTDTSIRLPGGARGTAGHILLGRDIWPSDGRPFTLEIWATQHSLKDWSRIFQIGYNWTNSFLMTWSRGVGLNKDMVRVTDGLAGSDSRNVFDQVDTLAPYVLDTEYHLAVTMMPETESGRWRITLYKQDAVTGETLKTCTGLAAEGWSPANLNQTSACLGYSFSKSDHDANASYNEVRVWAAALTEAQLTRNARLGPDIVCYPLTGDTSAAALPATSEIDVRAGAYLDLCGGTAEVASLTGAGTVMNGTLVSSDIRPGANGASGTLKMTDGATLKGTLVVAPAEDGTCGALASDGALDLSGLSLSVADGCAFKPGVGYTLAVCPPGALTGTFKSLPAGLTGCVIYDHVLGTVTCKVGGLSVIVR